MKVPRNLLGKLVTIVWRDPNFQSCEIEHMPVGRAALATWTEYGIVHDITDGIVLLAHSYCKSVGSHENDEISRTAIDEAVIESIVAHEVVKEAVP